MVGGGLRDPVERLVRQPEVAVRDELARNVGDREVLLVVTNRLSQLRVPSFKLHGDADAVAGEGLADGVARSRSVGS